MAKYRLPVRTIISMLGIYACALVYTSRAGMSVAIVAMTTHAQSPSTPTNATHECAAEDGSARRYERLLQTQKLVSRPEDREVEAEFRWSEKLQGVILGSQFYLYIVVPMFAGRVTDIFGGKWVAFVGTLGPCILSALTPVATRAWGEGLLIAIRILTGAFHGMVYPSLFSLYTKWFPVHERANANAGLSFGGGLGSTVMYLLAGWLSTTTIGWPAIFYANSLLAVPWMLLWLYFVTNDPDDNRRVSEKERKYIQTNMPKTVAKRTQAKWLHILTSIPVLCSLLVKMCCGFGYFLLLTKMPSYLSTIFGVDFFKNGSVNAAATLAQGVVGLLAAPFSNWIIQRSRIPSIRVRKAFQSVAMIGPCLCLCMIPAFGCNSTGVIVMLVVAMTAYGLFTGGEWTVVSEYAPNSAGAVFGFANILAFASGVAAPYIVGILLDAEAASNRSQWNLIFYITAGLYLFGALTFLVFGTDKQQEWDKTAPPTVEEDSGSSIGSKDTLDFDKAVKST